MSVDLAVVRALLPGNEHQRRLAALGEWPPGEYPVVRLVAALEDAVFEIEDWRASARAAAGEMCGDERHCTCRPLLLKRIAELEKAIKTALLDDESAPGGWGPDITMQWVLRDALLGGGSA